MGLAKTSSERGGVSDCILKNNLWLLITKKISPCFKENAGTVQRAKTLPCWRFRQGWLSPGGQLSSPLYFRGLPGPGRRKTRGSVPREKIQESADYQAARSSFFPRLTPPPSYYTRSRRPLCFGGQPPPKRQVYQEEYRGYPSRFRSESRIPATIPRPPTWHRGPEGTAHSRSSWPIRSLRPSTSSRAKENLRRAEEARNQRQEFAKLNHAFYKTGKVTIWIRSGPHPGIRSGNRRWPRPRLPCAWPSKSWPQPGGE